MDHFSDDRSGPDDRDLDHQVVERARLHPRQRRHLRAALDLEDPDGVGAREHRVHLGIAGRQMGEVDFDPFALAHQRDRLLQHRHHPKPQQIDLDDPEVGAVLLVPLDHHSPRHRGRLQRHDLVERPRANHHPAAMLPEMTRQVLDLAHQRDQPGKARRLDVDTAALEQRRQFVVAVAEFVDVVEPREAVDMFGREAQHLADLAHGAARAIGDHVGGHSGAALSVAAIDVLDDLLALVAARQIDIDVGPLPALLGEKALEQQLHPDRVDRRDPERIADRAVGRRAAPLRHDCVLAAELHDVPDDEEVAGKAKPRDYFEFVRELAEHSRAGAAPHRSRAPASTSSRR